MGEVEALGAELKRSQEELDEVHFKVSLNFHFPHLFWEISCRNGRKD